jgi:hypothetical protein
MRGQTNVAASAATVLVVAMLILVGVVIYGYFMQATPHDLPYFNESMCTTCSALTQYEFNHWPINNGTSSVLTCTNATGGLVLGSGSVKNATSGFNIIDSRYLNLTTPPLGTDTYANVVCDYYYDAATADQESFWSNATQNGLAGFAIISVIVIVLVAVAIIGIVLLLKG